MAVTKARESRTILPANRKLPVAGFAYCQWTIAHGGGLASTLSNRVIRSAIRALWFSASFHKYHLLSKEVSGLYKGLLTGKNAYGLDVWALLMVPSGVVESDLLPRR